MIGGWASAPEGSMERRVYDEAAARVQASRPADMEAGAYSGQELFPYAVQVALEIGVKPNLLAKPGTVARFLGMVRHALRQVWDKITRKPELFNAQDLVNLAFGIAQRENPEHAGELNGALTDEGASNAERRIQPVRLDLQGWDGSRAQLRELASGWYSENLQGKSFPNDDMGVDVQFSSEGKGVAFNTSGNLREGWRAEMVKALPELVKRAVKVDENAPDARRTRDTKAFHTLVAPLSVNGKVLAAKITLREALMGPDQRHKFYDIAALEIEDGSVLSGLKGSDQGQNPLPTGTEPSRATVAQLVKACTA